ncbi:sensor histidine kinase [Vallitalea okinawensis]|uniref:sensor histidine kinase n=1 Tax=Vallitalea okinawensis TaxID=2078660 RepID=UPI0014793AD8|nr:histidine kinase [Vallitalea okinawensis]
MRGLGNRFHDISIKKKLIIFVLMMLIYPILLVIFFGVYNNEKIIKDRFVSYVENDVKGTKTRISKDLKDMESFFQDLLYNIDIYDLFKAKPSDIEENDVMANYIFKRDIEKYLKSTIYAKREFDLVTIQFIDEDNVYYAERETGFIDIDEIPTDIFIDLIEEKNQVIYYYDHGYEKSIIYLVRAVYDLDSFEKMGVMSFRIDHHYLEEIVQTANRDPAESTHLYTDSGERLISVGQRYNDSIVEENQLYLQDEGTYSYEVDGKDYYVIVKAIEGVNLRIISIMSTDMLIADTEQVLKIILILCLISIPIYILIANIFYKDIISPFNLLIQKMKNIEKGELNTVIDIQRKNEIGYLYHSFNSMAKRLKYLVEYVYEEEIARKNAEISALQSQINPHFLYNTLETINWKAQLSGEQDIAEMIQALSNLMDANMNRNGEKYITVKQEIKYMDSYLFLIQKRFGDKIAYEKNVEEETLDKKLPKLIIQPIIENAIKHGIQPIGRGKVSLYSSLSDDNLVIYVEDNGVGIERAELEQIKQGHRHSDLKSIGLNNVIKRLKLIYGEEANVHIESEVAQGTKVRVMIPVSSE